ncbi:carbohydrate ABC transporter permease [Phytoactinopolyspora alkaliphila]|uniref:Carbohydrate ABC transporter permease n=1 Tax=Phytoactinopolyspora alkaliphila TaxID=1783498 RepID=A0A6N9YGR4_9ACTN|nr:carbohydrate ABC transporter permease [Phytoactinopolyspora alkaliphila]NED94069.1 carbohydrate ABC transporter permease [Phytoactinopolyspora alkaliphila]
MTAVATATLPERRTPPRPARSPSRRRRRLLGVLTVVIAAIWAFPVYWMVNSSLLPYNRIRNPDPTFFPLGGTVGAYGRVLEGNFLSSMRISMMVTLITVGAALLFAFLAALALSRFRFRGRKSFVVTVLIIQMIPAEGLFISQFKLLEGWKLLNSVLGLSLLYIAAVVPFTIWMLRGFVAGVPRDLEEAALVDGCSRTQAFFRITLPLLAPGLVASGVYAFLQAWNEFTLALVVMTRPENMTLPLWLRTFTDANRVSDWAGIMAGSVLIAVPVMVFFLLVQHRMASGLVSGAVKG